MRRNETGFSIVQVLVASVLVGILSIAVIKMLQNSQKGQSAVEESLDFLQIRSTLWHITQDTTLCSLAFRDSSLTQPAKFHPSLAIPPNEKPHAVFLKSQPFLTLGQKIGRSQNVSNIELIPQSGTGPYTVQLVVEVSSTDQYAAVKKRTNLSIPLLFQLTTNASNAISQCGQSLVGPPTQPAGTICGGYTTKYGSGFCSSCTYATFGCGITGGSCPSGYVAIPSAYVTAANFENTWLCLKN